MRIPSFWELTYILYPFTDPALFRNDDFPNFPRWDMLVFVEDIFLHLIPVVAG